MARTRPHMLGIPPAGTIVLLANAAGTAMIAVPSDAEFECFFFQSYATGAYRYAVRDSGLNEQLSNILVDAYLTTGGTTPAGANPRYPLLLPSRARFGRGSSIAVDMQDLSGAPNTITFILIGQLVYP